MHCEPKFSGLRYGKRQWIYFCEQLQDQDFVQYTGYVISSIVIKILNIFQIKFTFNSVVCVFSNMATGHLPKHWNTCNLVSLWSPSASGIKKFPLWKNRGNVIQRLLLRAETFCLTKCTHLIGKKKKIQRGQYTYWSHIKCWNESVLTLGSKCFLVRGYCAWSVATYAYSLTVNLRHCK